MINEIVQSCFNVDKSVLGLSGGISTDTFQKFLMKMMQDWQIIDIYQERASEAIEFQYTHWPDPDNRTARGQEFINVSSLSYLLHMSSALFYSINLSKL